MKRFEPRSRRMRRKHCAHIARSLFVPLAALTGVFLLGASPARAGDAFERGFEGELGRIAAHEAVRVGRHVLHDVVGGVAVYDVRGPVRYEPWYRHPPRCVPPKHHGKHYAKHHRKHHGKHAWKHHRKHRHKHHRHHDCDWCGGCRAHPAHGCPGYPVGRRHAAYGGW